MTIDEILSSVMGGVRLDLSAQAVARVVLLLLAGIIVIRIVMKLVDRILERSRELASLRGYIRSTVRVALWLLLVLVVLGSLGIEMTSIIALLSVAGLAVSLALQNTLSNVAGGIMILVSKPFAPGDYVELDGVSGTVAVSGLSYSKFITADNKAVFVPNSQVAAAKIINYTAMGKRRAELTFSVSYDTPDEAVRAALQEVLDSLPQILSDPAPEIRLSAYQSSSVQYLVRAWATTDDYWEMYYALLDRVRGAFVRHGVRMTYDHLNVHIMDR